MSTALPIPPSGTPYIDPATGQVALVWSNFFLALSAAATTGFAPADAEYWVASSNGTLTNERNLGALTTGYVKATVGAGTAIPSTVASIPGADITGAALTRVSDTNVTLTLGGTPATALLKAVSVTAGWAGTLATARGGTSVDIASAALPLGSGQVAFPATQNPSAGANVLDDYEESTWTPTDASGAGLALTVNAATYVKIGQFVSAFFQVTYPVTASGAAAILGGLPFTSITSAGGVSGPVAWGFTNFATPLLGYVASAGTTIVLTLFGGAAVTNANLSALTLAGTAMYRASA